MHQQAPSFVLHQVWDAFYKARGGGGGGALFLCEQFQSIRHGIRKAREARVNWTNFLEVEV